MDEHIKFCEGKTYEGCDNNFPQFQGAMCQYVGGVAGTGKCVPAQIETSAEVTESEDSQEESQVDEEDAAVGLGDHGIGRV